MTKKPSHEFSILSPLALQEGKSSADRFTTPKGGAVYFIISVEDLDVSGSIVPTLFASIIGSETKHKIDAMPIITQNGVYVALYASGISEVKKDLYHIRSIVLPPTWFVDFALENTGKVLVGLSYIPIG